MSKGTGTILEFVLGWYAEEEPSMMGEFDKDDDTAVTYPLLLGSRSMSSMLDEYDANTDEELGFVKTPGGNHVDTRDDDDDSGIYISLDDYRQDSWRSCRASFRRSTDDLLSDEVDPKIELHMTLPNTPERATMPPFSVYYGTSKEDREWRKLGSALRSDDGHQESKKPQSQERTRIGFATRANHADRNLFRPLSRAAHAA